MNSKGVLGTYSTLGPYEQQGGAGDLFYPGPYEQQGCAGVCWTYSTPDPRRGGHMADLTILIKIEFYILI